MSEIKKIMIMGGIGCGKDTMADYLVEKRGFTKIRLADPAYYIARKYFFMRKKNRRLLQFIGQSARQIYPDIWINYALKRADKLVSQGYKVAISDIRQKNEFVRGVEAGFLPVKIYTPMQLRIERSTSRDGQKPNLKLWNKKAEIGVNEISDGYALWVDNFRSVEVFYENIDRLIDDEMAQDYPEILKKVFADNRRLGVRL